jgi:hypothetical protein
MQKAGFGAISSFAFPHSGSHKTIQMNISRLYENNINDCRAVFFKKKNHWWFWVFEKIRS